MLGFQGYIYYIVVYVRFVNSSVELLIMWCLVVNLCQLIMDVLPPSAAPRGRPISAGMVINLRSYTNLVSLLCLWTCVFTICFNVGLILEEHGCHEWTISTWSIRVDPCSKQSYIYIFFIIFIYIFTTTIIISILKNFPYLLCCMDSPLQSSGSPAWCRTYGLKEYLLLPFETPPYILI